jgi:hypothetical protein
MPDPKVYAFSPAQALPARHGGDVTPWGFDQLSGNIPRVVDVVGLRAGLGSESLSSSNVLKRHLHPALKEIGYINEIPGTDKAGSHAFQRFRNTFLKNHSSCPPGLYKYWARGDGDE